LSLTSEYERADKATSKKKKKNLTIAEFTLGTKAPPIRPAPVEIVKGDGEEEDAPGPPIMMGDGLLE
jgi:hypothetical protein